MRTKLLLNDWLWLGGLILLVSLHFWFPRLGAGPRHDTYSAAAEGKKAFFLLVRSDPAGRGHSVRRNLAPVGRLATAGRLRAGGSGEHQSQSASGLCLLGPARYPNEAEWRSLLDWVSRGGSLIVAAREEQPEFSIRELDIQVKRVRGRIDVGADRISTALIDGGDLIWQSRGRIVATPRARRLVEVGGTTQAVVQSHGSGNVVVLASDFIFSNQSLAYADHANAELALRLLEAAGLPRTIHFDESLNIAGTPKVVGLLLDPFLRAVTVQLLIVLLVFAWWQSRRFGPLVPEAATARQNIVDHTDAVGLLQYRSKDGTTALQSYLKQLIAELKLKSHRGREDRVLEPIAVRLGTSTQAVRKVLAQSTKAARTKRLERRTAAHIIRRLAVLRRAAHRRGE